MTTGGFVLWGIGLPRQAVAGVAGGSGQWQVARNRQWKTGATQVKAGRSPVVSW